MTLPNSTAGEEGGGLRLLNKTQVAELLGVSVWTVEKYWKTGELGSVKFSNASKSPRRSTLEHIRTFIARREEA